jgi:hypothetical protein
MLLYCIRVYVCVATAKAPHDECDPANIVTGRRRHKKVDYALLNAVVSKDKQHNTTH